MKREQVNKWEIFEVAVPGKSAGNPFTDYSIQGLFSGDQETVTVDGFYDGDGCYKIRFMPSFEGIYTWRAEGSFSDTPFHGEFEVIGAADGSHGVVRVVHSTHFAYTDGTPYYPLGTTCYAWIFQDEEIQEQTLRSLKDSPFNKLRFCVYPKSYTYNLKEPYLHPYVRGHGEGLDKGLADKFRKEKVPWPIVDSQEDFEFNYYCFNTKYFQLLDRRMEQLMNLGIEADLILMHPYDRWGHVAIDKEGCDLYIRYMAARYGAFRNVWWSLANEYDIVPTKSEEDWERYASILCKKDPYHHLRSIHNFLKFYDYSRPWITHCSMQRLDSYKPTEDTDKYIEKYNKPVVWDEIGYEGNFADSFGNLLPQEMVRIFWEAALRGGYGQHSETYTDPKNIIWWSHGGELKGESPKRLKFLLDILKAVPGGYLKKDPFCYGKIVGIPVNEDKKDMFATASCEIHYMGFRQPASCQLFLPEDAAYDIDIIDTWEMTIKSAGRFCGRIEIELPQKPYMAVRLRRVMSV